MSSEAGAFGPGAKLELMDGELLATAAGVPAGTPARSGESALMTGRFQASALTALLACMSPVAGPLGAATALAAVQDPDGSREPERSPTEQEAQEEPPTFEERVVVVGTRAEPRTATASPVPIDAIPARDIVTACDPALLNPGGSTTDV